jgi:hypothetical protein
MKTTLFAVAALFFLFCERPYGRQSQKNVIDSIQYINESIAFIKNVMADKIKDTAFILSDKPATDDGCIKVVAADSFFSSEESKWITQKEYPQVAQWTSSMFPGKHLFNPDPVYELFAKKGDGWAFFYKNIGHGIGSSFYSFSMPVFLRDYTYCIFYYDVKCGWLCGDGHMTLYKKEDGKWIRVKHYCQWIS